MSEEDDFRTKMIKQCEQYDKVATLYDNWIESIAIHTRYEDVYEHLINHIDEDITDWKAEDHRRWELSLLNLFAILEKQLECHRDIKEQCKIIYKKALVYQENYNDDGDYFENDYIESYKKLMDAQK